MRHDGRVALGQFAIRLGEHCRDLRVGQPCLRMHHRWIETIFFDIAAAADMHVAHHAQAVHMRIQGAQPIGQFFRQHRDYAAREIHRVAAQDRLAIKRVTGLHIMADIGNRHDQTVAAFFRRAIHRIIEVARGLAVYGDQRQVADILAPRPVFR